MESSSKSRCSRRRRRCRRLQATRMIAKPAVCERRLYTRLDHLWLDNVDVIDTDTDTPKMQNLTTGWPA